MKELYFIAIKKVLENKTLKKEQIDYILFMLDENIQEHYKEKMLVLEKQIKEKEQEILNLKKEKDILEIENNSISKKMEVVVDTNKMLLNQLEQRDNTTIHTLESIQHNLILGSQISNGLEQINKKNMLLLESSSDDNKKRK